MSIDPRILGYNIPYQPIFDSTKLQIQRSLFSLEEKLRRRKQIDLDFQLQRQSALIAPPPPPPNYYESLIDYEEKERVHRAFAEEQIHLEQVVENNKHMARLQQLRLERDQLTRDNLLAVPISRQSPTFHLSSGNDDDQLIKKYQDGSKAKQYYYDLGKQLKRQEEADIRQAKADFQQEQTVREQIKQQIQKQQQEFHSQRSGGKQRQIGKISSKPAEATPYDYLRQPKSSQKQTTGKKRYDRGHLAKELEKEFDQLQRKPDTAQKSHKKHVQSVFKIPSIYQETDRTTSPVRFLKDTSPRPNQLSPYKQTINRYKSMGKMPCNRSKSALSPHKVSIIETSYLKAKQAKIESKPSVRQLQLNAIKKIQNRLKVSQIIYEDSRLKTNKYESNHLFNTFEIESKCRREIKDKINAHPFVLRKHSMVVQ